MPVLVGGKPPKKKKPKIKGEWLAIGLGLPVLLIVGAIAFMRDSTPELQNASPTPVASPAPAAPPSPEGALPVVEVSPGIGVSRSAIQSVFEAPGIGFVFEESSRVQGQPRVMGTAPNQIAIIELIGSPNELTTAAIIIGVPTDNDEAVAQNAAYTLRFLEIAVPGWANGSDWLIQNLDALNQGTARRASTVFGDKRIELVALTEVSMFSLSVKPSQH